MAQRRLGVRYVGVAQSVAGSSQETVTIFTATFPTTITNCRLMIQCRDSAADNFFKIYFVLHVNRQNQGSSPIGDTDGADIYSPERDVIIVSYRSLATVTSELTEVIDDRDSRKFRLLNGDKLSLTFENDSTNTLDSIRGFVQFELSR